MPTVSETIDIMKISQYLASADVAKGNLFSPQLDERLPLMLYTERRFLEKIYLTDSTYDGLQEVANYCYGLCAPYVSKAQDILNTGSGGSSGGVTPPATLPLPIEFTVSGSSEIVDGGNNATIIGFVGYNLLFVRGNTTQSQINDGGSYYTWNRTTGNFYCYPSAQTGELFQLIPIG